MRYCILQDLKAAPCPMSSADLIVLITLISWDKKANEINDF